MSRSNFTEDEKQQIDHLKDVQGMSSRKICREMKWNPSRKSSVNTYLNNRDTQKSVEEPESPDEFDLNENELDTLCGSPDWNVSNLAKRLRAAQRTNNQLRKIQREVFDGKQEAVSLEDILGNLSKDVGKSTIKTLDYSPDIDAVPATLEVLFSDLQIGKLTRHYNKHTSMSAMEAYGKKLLAEIEFKSEKFKLERVILELLGDLCEDNTKHGIQSAISTDCGLSEQMHLAIKGIWEHVLRPLAELGVEIEVVCVVGNHGSSTHKGMGTFKEGLYGYDYVIFKTLEQFCEVAQLDNVKFNIPEGTFAMTEVYGNHIVLEHGYNNNISEKGMVDQMRKRGAQMKVHPTYWRQADKHHYICYGNGEQICNAAWFGVDSEALEWSGMLGFSSIPCQTLVWHTDEQSAGNNTVKDIVNIQVFQES